MYLRILLHKHVFTKSPPPNEQDKHNTKQICGKGGGVMAISDYVIYCQFLIMSAYPS